MKTKGGFKFCPRCRNFKEAAVEFGRDAQRSDGLHTHCRVCRRIYRLRRKPEPTIGWHVNTLNPRRLHVPQKLWPEFDLLAEAGYKVPIILPNMTIVDWSTLE